MEWYNYIGCFFAGMFLANFIPHFVHGISGNNFFTPFSHGKEMSSPTLNVVWALVNLLVGFLLFRAAKISTDNVPSLIVFFIGIGFISIFLSKRFPARKKKVDNE